MLAYAPQVQMLEGVVRQLSQNLSIAEKAAGSAQAQSDAGATVKSQQAQEQEIRALNAKVSCCILPLLGDSRAVFCVAWHYVVMLEKGHLPCSCVEFRLLIALHIDLVQNSLYCS